MALVSDANAGGTTGTIFTAPFTATGNVSLPVFTLFCWVKFPTTVTGTQQFLGLANPAHNNASLAKSGGGNAESAIWNDDSTNSRSASENGFTPQPNVWAPMCGLFTFTGQKATLITTRATNSNTFTSGTLGTSAWSQVQLLARAQGGAAAAGFLNTGGMLAECACWVGNLTSAEYNMLVFNQLSPWRVRQQDLIFYMPLRFNAYDYGPLHLPFTASGTLGAFFTGDHPIPLGPTYDSRLWMFTPSGATVFNKAVSTSQGEGLGLVKQAGVIRSVGSAEVLSFARLVSSLRQYSLTSPNVAALVRQAARFRSFSAASPEATSRLLSMSHAATVGSPESASMSRTMAALRSFGATDPESVSLSRLLAFRRSISASDPQSPSLLKAVGLIRGASDPETASLIARRAKLSASSTSQTQAASLRRLVGVLRGVSSPESVRLGVTVAAIRSLTQASIATLSRNTGWRRGATSSSTASLSTRLSIARTLVAVNPQSIRLLHAVGTVRATANAQSASLARAVGKGLAVAETQSARMARQVSHLASAVQANTATLGRNMGHIMAATMSSVAQLTIPRGGLLFNLSQSMAVSGQRSRLLAPLRAVLQQSVGFSTFFHTFVPHGLRTRMVRLPLPSSMSTLPPVVRRIVLPREEDQLLDFQIHRAEPDRFSTFDPTDQDVFTFDWGQRGYPGDAIVWAEIISIPGDLNFIGPTFIDSYVVPNSSPQVLAYMVSRTIGAFSPLSLPASYTLRCSVNFASGRVGNYSVPFQVKAL